MNKLRILFMADVVPEPDSGASGTEVQTIRALRCLGCEVDTVWSLELPRKIKHGNLHYLLELPAAYRRVMLSRLHQKSYDVIHVNQPHGYLAAKTHAHKQRCSVFIHRSHGLELRADSELTFWMNKYPAKRRSVVRRISSTFISRFMSTHSRKIARYADGHIVYANQCANFLHEKLGVPREHIAVIPPAPPELYLTRPLDVMTPQRLKHVLYVSQFAYFKAPMIVAKVINKLVDANEKIRFTWVCSIANHQQVRQLLSSVARERVKLLDWMPQSELINVYDNHGIFLFPSFFEGFGKVFLEAMARGLCVIASDNSGAHDVIENHVNSILVSTGSVDEMYQECLGIIEKPESAVQLSKQARETAMHYTWQRAAKETLGFYESRLREKR